MTPNNNLSVLPFYTDIEKQNHRKDYSYGDVYSLITPDKNILPFQIVREYSGDSISLVTLRKLDGSTSIDITDEMIDTGLVINQYESDGYEVVIYKGILPMAITTPEGQYYLEITIGTTIYYSDVFCYVRDVTNMLKIQYWDEESFIYNNGLIDYTTGFKFTIYLDTQLGRPEYEFDESVDDRDGFAFYQKQISEKTFKFIFIAPEYLCDAMRFIRMSDNITITNKGDVYNADTFLITPKWQSGGYIASVEAEFQCDTILKKIGKTTTSGLAAFNDSFNESFDTE